LRVARQSFDQFWFWARSLFLVAQPLSTRSPVSSTSPCSFRVPSVRHSLCRHAFCTLLGINIGTLTRHVDRGIRQATPYEHGLLNRPGNRTRQPKRERSVTEFVQALVQRCGCPSSALTLGEAQPADPDVSARGTPAAQPARPALLPPKISLRKLYSFYEQYSRALCREHVSRRTFNTICSELPATQSIRTKPQHLPIDPPCPVCELHSRRGGATKRTDTAHLEKHLSMMKQIESAFDARVLEARTSWNEASPLEFAHLSWGYAGATSLPLAPAGKKYPLVSVRLPYQGVWSDEGTASQAASPGVSPSTSTALSKTATSSSTSARVTTTTSRSSSSVSSSEVVPLVGEQFLSTVVGDAAESAVSSQQLPPSSDPVTEERKRRRAQSGTDSPKLVNVLATESMPLFSFSMDHLGLRTHQFALSNDGRPSLSTVVYLLDERHDFSSSHQISMLHSYLTTQEPCLGSAKHLSCSSMNVPPLTHTTLCYFLSRVLMQYHTVVEWHLLPSRHAPSSFTAQTLNPTVERLRDKKQWVCTPAQLSTLIQSHVPDVRRALAMTEIELKQCSGLRALFESLPALPYADLLWLRIESAPPIASAAAAELVVRYALISSPDTQHSLAVSAPAQQVLQSAWERLPALPIAPLQPNRARQLHQYAHRLQEMDPSTAPLLEHFLAACHTPDCGTQPGLSSALGTSASASSTTETSAASTSANTSTNSGSAASVMPSSSASQAHSNARSTALSLDGALSLCQNAPPAAAADDTSSARPHRTCTMDLDPDDDDDEEEDTSKEGALEVVNSLGKRKRS